MTMDREQNSRVSRRAFLTATGATAAGTAIAAIPLMQSAAKAAESDEIHALYERLRELERKIKEATSREDVLRAARRTLKESPPEALRRRDTDHELGTLAVAA